MTIFSGLSSWLAAAKTNLITWFASFKQKWLK